MDIKSNIELIKNNIDLSCKKVNRSADDIILMAVTKTIDTERMLEAYNAGLNVFGENKVQEIRDKYPIIGDKVKWHMIGTLQTNKVKYIIDKVELIHSVDNVKLAEEINKRAAAIKKVQNILIEINIGMEETKSGIPPIDMVDFIKSISNLQNIHIQGLMTVAPATDDKEKTRPYFKKMFDLFNDLKNAKIPNTEAKYLSMGMTNDYTVAIEEGANIVRIGTGIFGKRNYMK